MTQFERLLYTGKVRTIDGRNGASRSSDGRLDVQLSTPGTPGSGTNPEQLFAAGWSACFEGAMGLAAREMKIVLPADLAISAEVDLNTSEGAYFLRARLNVSLPGLEREVAQRLVKAAHRTCPLFQGDTRQHRRRDQPNNLLFRRALCDSDADSASRGSLGPLIA